MDPPETLQGPRHVEPAHPGAKAASQGAFSNNGLSWQWKKTYLSRGPEAPGPWTHLPQQPNRIIPQPIRVTSNLHIRPKFHLQAQVEAGIPRLK